jgi:type IV pilus assembly protein PilX
MIAKKQTNTPAREELSIFFSENVQNIAQHDRRNQRGITLIMVLIFIVTLSLIAAVAMRGVITGDRVVANERDRSIAFQGAESAIREAVTLIAAGDTTKWSASGLKPGGLPLAGNAEHWRTTSKLTEATTCTAIPISDAATTRFNWTDAAACSAKSLVAYDNFESPRFVIELTSKVPVGTAVPVAKYECWYRVTSRATGGTGEADVILQAMFSVEIPPGKCPNEP